MTIARCSTGSPQWSAQICRGRRCRRSTASETGHTNDTGCGAIKDSGSVSTMPWHTQLPKCPCRYGNDCQGVPTP